MLKTFNKFFRLHNVHQCIRTIHSSQMSQAKLQLNDISINYEIYGCGQTVALCLPGVFGTTKSNFGPQLHSLAGDDVTLVVWDPPGYGDSRPPTRNFTLDYLDKDAELAGQMMKKLGYNKYSILGFSEGGTTGMILASTYPECIEKLIIWSSRAYLGDDDIVINKAKREIDNWPTKMRASLEAIYGKDYLRTLVDTHGDNYTAIHKEKNGDLCMGALVNITSPTLVMHGGKDTIVSVEHANYLHKNIKGSKLHLFDEGKHPLHLQYVNGFNKMVLEFLNPSHTNKPVAKLLHPSQASPKSRL